MRQRQWPARVLTLGLAVWLASFYSLPEVTLAELKGQEFSSVVKLKPGKISGVVTSVDRKTPVSGVSIRVIDQKTGKVVAEVTTDKNGSYAVGPLSAGKYQVVVAGWMVTDVELTPQAKLTQLSFILPRAAHQFPAADIMSDVEAGAVPLVKSSLVRTVVLTAAVTTIVVVPVVAVIARREREKKKVFVSPSIP